MSGPRFVLFLHPKQRRGDGGEKRRKKGTQSRHGRIYNTSPRQGKTYILSMRNTTHETRTTSERDASYCIHRVGETDRICSRARGGGGGWSREPGEGEIVTCCSRWSAVKSSVGTALVFASSSYWGVGTPRPGFLRLIPSRNRIDDRLHWSQQTTFSAKDQDAPDARQVVPARTK